MRGKDAAALVANHVPDIVCYDLLEPLQYRGVEGVRQRAQEWFDGFEGPMGYEIIGLEIVAAFDVAFSYGIHHVTGTTTDGQKIDMHWRSTRVFQRLEDKWKIMHEHGSVPFDMKTEPDYFCSTRVEVAGPSPMISSTTSSSLAPS